MADDGIYSEAVNIMGAKILNSRLLAFYAFDVEITQAWAISDEEERKRARREAFGTFEKRLKPCGAPSVESS